MEREILLRVDSEHNIVGSFDKIYEEDKEMAQWYMEKVKSPSEEIYKAKWDRAWLNLHAQNERKRRV